MNPIAGCNQRVKKIDDTIPIIGGKKTFYVLKDKRAWHLPSY